MNADQNGPTIRNLGPDDSSIMVQLKATVVTSVGAPGTARFIHNLDDPHAIWLGAVSSTGANIVGAFALDLLTDALDTTLPQGQGVIRITLKPHALIIDIKGDNGRTAVVAVMPGQLEPFVAACRKRAAQDHSAQIDAELTKLLEGI